MLSLNFNPKKTTRLFGLENEFNFLKKMISSDKFPKTLMLTGNRGVGKSTMISHLMHYYFDKKTYNENENTFVNESFFLNQFIENLFPNILYLNGSDYRNVRIDDIRKIINDLNKSPIKKDKRFIILDDIDSFNINSLNALLKIIEEPLSNNYFILINSKTKPLIETIYSRSLEIKILLSNEIRVKIIESLIKKNNLEVLIDFNSCSITPGNFLSFNKIFEENKINLNEDYHKNLEKLLNLYKKTKNKNFINTILFITENYFYNLHEKKIYNIEKIIENKSFVINNINNFITYNLNQNSVINAINNKLLNE